MSLSAALIVSMIGVTGCGTTKNADNNVTTKSVRNNVNKLNNGVHRYGVNSVNNNDNLITRSDNTMGNLRYSKELSDKISKMKQVGSAKVMLTDHNAYVAVSIKDGNTMKGTSTNLNTTNNRMGNVTGMNDSNIMGTGTGTGGTMMGLGAPTQNGVSSNVTNQTGGGGNYPTNRDHGYGSLGTSSYGLMRGLTTSPTPGTGNVVGGNEDQYITQEVKDMISDTIKKSDSTITNVYVSANPEFVDRVGGYVSDVSSGHPISGIVDEFQTLVNRIFPTKSGSNVNNNSTKGPLNNLGR